MPCSGGAAAGGGAMILTTETVDLQVDGRVLRAEVPAKVNARSIPLLAEAKAIVGNQGRVTVI